MTPAPPAPDRDNAFLPYPAVRIVSAGQGLLVGARLAVKDIFDVAGYPTGAGNAFVLAASGIKAQSAPIVDLLLDAGANFVGKTYTDELAYSVLGRNLHFGVSINPTFPDVITGGSSSGSAVAVAQGLADIGLGSDTSGSIRIPAAMTGSIGWRPTHGILSLAGCRPLAPSFDTAAFVVRDIDLLDRLMAVSGFAAAPGTGQSVIVAEELLNACDAAVAEEFLETLVRHGIEPVRGRLLGGICLANLNEAFQTILWHEAWLSNAELYERRPDCIDAPIRERLELGKGISLAQVEEARQVQAEFKSAVVNDISDRIVCFPTLPVSPPGPAAPAQDYNLFRQRALALNCVAGLAGLPQLAVPAGTRSPMGSLSLLSGPLADRGLCHAAKAFLPALGVRF